VKRWKTTLIVVAVFAAILAYVLLVEKKKEPPPKPGITPSPTPVQVLDIELDAVRAVRVTDGVRSVRIAREGEGWSVTHPEDAPANTYAVFLPIDELIHLEARLIVAEEVSDAATYGLDPVALRIVVETASGREERFHVGRETPDTTAFYVQYVGDPRLYTVSHYKIAPFFEWLATPPYQPTPAAE
jgi:hypothetical protein